MKRLFSDNGLQAVQNDEPWKKGINEVNCWSGEQGVDGTQSTGLLWGEETEIGVQGGWDSPKPWGREWSHTEKELQNTHKCPWAFCSLWHRVKLHKAWQRAAGSWELNGSWSSRSFSIISRASTSTLFSLEFTHPTQRISFTPTAPSTLVTSKTVS